LHTETLALQRAVILFLNGVAPMGHRWGYARVSTDDQTTALQVDALRAAGVPAEHIVEERVSGAAKVRPTFQALLGRLEPGDELVVWKVALDPKNASPHYNLGNVLRDMGRRDEAIAEYKAAIALDPTIDEGWLI
jgi:tetratricopeptide (TPR) repeat protein